MYLAHAALGLGFVALLALKGALEPAMARLREEFEAGLAEYRKASWEAADARFQACLALKPLDGPSLVYADRVKHFRVHPPPPGAWDGIWSFSEK